MKKVTINGKSYDLIPLTFNTVCDLDDMGIGIDYLSSKPNAFIRAYASLMMKSDIEHAGNELEQHIINGGTLEELAEGITEAVNESDFFQVLKAKAEESNPSSQSKEKQ